MISTDLVIVVEGKYDKINLENYIDAVIIPTNGFKIFKDKDKRALIKRLAEKCGVAVLTDSDKAGLQIRGYLKNICGEDKIVNVYIPKIEGKEKRKSSPGKEGLIGVEGMSEDVILNAFERAGVTAHKTGKVKVKITKHDLYFFGLSGRENSALLRESLSRYLDIPTGMSSSAFLDAVNTLYGAEEFERQVALWRQEEDKK